LPSFLGYRIGRRFFVADADDELSLFRFRWGRLALRNGVRGRLGRRFQVNDFFLVWFKHRALP